MARPLPTALAPDLGLEIGGLRWRLRADDARWREALSARYGPFFAAADGACDLELELVATSLPPSSADFWRGIADDRFSAVCDADRLVVASPSTRVELDWRARRLVASGPLHRHVVDVAVRTALALLVEDGLLVHGALLGDGTRGWLAAGPSGCGKTTLAALFPERRGCDELTLVRRTAGAWHAYPLPFWNGAPGRLRLAGLHLLRHGSADGRRRLGTAEALRLLGREVQWPDFQPGALAAAWGRLVDLLQAVPAYELSFRPTPAVWDLLTLTADDDGCAVRAGAPPAPRGAGGRGDRGEVHTRGGGRVGGGSGPRPRGWIA